MYTAWYDRVDNFWFTLAHEIAHVLLHLPKMKDQSFLDDLSVKETSTLEKEADQAAEGYLRVQDIIRLATPFAHYLSESRIDLVSRQLEIDPSIIVGVLQYHGLTDYRKLNSCKRKVLVEIPGEYVVG